MSASRDQPGPAAHRPDDAEEPDRAPPGDDGVGAQEERVGYGRPPRHGRFKPGRSGNPKGRPRGARSLSTIFTQVLAEPVTIRIGERTRRMSTAEALVRGTVRRASNGDPKAMAAVLALTKQAGDTGDVADRVDPASLFDEAILDDFIARVRRREDSDDGDQS